LTETGISVAVDVDRLAELVAEQVARRLATLFPDDPAPSRAAASRPQRQGGERRIVVETLAGAGSALQGEQPAKAFREPARGAIVHLVDRPACRHQDAREAGGRRRTGPGS
jgi:hypothetical protein